MQGDDYQLPDWLESMAKLVICFLQALSRESSLSFLLWANSVSQNLDSHVSCKRWPDVTQERCRVVHGVGFVTGLQAWPLEVQSNLLRTILFLSLAHVYREKTGSQGEDFDGCRQWNWILLRSGPPMWILTLNPTWIQFLTLLNKMGCSRSRFG